MSKWKVSVEPKGALSGHFLFFSGRKTEAQGGGQLGATQRASGQHSWAGAWEPAACHPL